MSLLHFEKEFYIHTNYADCNDYLRPSSVLDLCQDMAGMHAKKLGLGFKDVFEKGYYWVVLYTQFEVVGNHPRVDTDILVKTWPKQRGKLEFEREYEICDLDGNLMIKAISNWAIIDVEKRMISRAKDIDFTGEYYLNNNYTEKQKRKLNLEAKPFDKELIHKVSITDLDHNGHMNNARYLDLILNMEDPNNIRVFKHVEIAFVHEVRVNDDLHVGHYIDDEGYDCYIGSVDDSLMFEVKIKY